MQHSNNDNETDTADTVTESIPSLHIPLNHNYPQPSPATFVSGAQLRGEADGGIVPPGEQVQNSLNRIFYDQRTQK